MTSGDARADTAAAAPRLREALRAAASALKEKGPRFALAGSYALWAYGAPEPSHDADLVVAEADVETAVTTLASAGFEIERPPEDWLFKARTGDMLVDVLHRLNGVPVDAQTLDRAEHHDVLAIGMPVLPPTMCSSSSCARWASTTATSPSCCPRCAPCANGWTGTKSGLRPPTTTTRSPSWCWPNDCG